MNKKKIIFIVLLAILLSVFPVHAYEYFGTLHGSVIDATSNLPLRNVKIEIRDELIQLTTDDTGKFLVYPLKFGEYFIKFQKTGYYPFKTNISIYSSLKKLKIKLQPRSKVSINQTKNLSIPERAKFKTDENIDSTEEIDNKISDELPPELTVYEDNSFPRPSNQNLNHHVKEKIKKEKDKNLVRKKHIIHPFNSENKKAIFVKNVKKIYGLKTEKLTTEKKLDRKTKPFYKNVLHKIKSLFKRERSHRKFYNILGKIHDAETKKPLSGVKVSIGDKTTLSDKMGRFSIKTSKDKAKLTFKKTGYVSYSRLIKLNKAYVILDVPLRNLNSKAGEITHVYKGQSAGWERKEIENEEELY